MTSTSHSETFAASYDEDVQAGYFQFCSCSISKTIDMTERTNFSLLADESEVDGYGKHVVGIEYLVPITDTDKLLKDLQNFPDVTVEQLQFMLRNI